LLFAAESLLPLTLDLVRNLLIEQTQYLLQWILSGKPLQEISGLPVVENID